jgi:hypothetical protein
MKEISPRRSQRLGGDHLYLKYFTVMSEFCSAGIGAPNAPQQGAEKTLSESFDGDQDKRWDFNH